MVLQSRAHSLSQTFYSTVLLSHIALHSPTQGATEFAAAKRARLQAGRAASGAAPSARRKHHGIAFGTGVMDEDDSYGIMEDYVTPEEVAGELESARADARGLPARRAAGLDRRGLGDRLAAEGYTFEIQEEEEEEEEEVSGFMGRPLLARLGGPAAPALLKSKEQLAHASFVPGFLKAHRPVETRSFPPPTLPPGWRPRPPSEVRGTGPDLAQPSHAPPAAPPADPKLRQAIDTTAFYVARNGKIFENMARRQQEKAIEAGEGEGHAFLLGGAGAAYYAAKLAAVRALLAAPGAPARDRGKGAEEPRARAAPLSSAERGALLGEQPLPPGERPETSPPIEAPPASAQRAAVPARSVLGSVAEADRLRLAGLLKSSFGSAGAERGGSEDAGGLRPGAGAATRPGTGEAAAGSTTNAAMMGPEPGPSRVVHGRIVTAADLSRPMASADATVNRLPVRSGRDWRPEPLLCKRLNVADPYRGRPRELVMPSSRTDFLALPATAAEVAQGEGRSAGAGALAVPASDQAFIEDGDTVAGEMPDADSFLASILSAGTDEGTTPPLPPAPPVDVFKAIFEDDDDDEDEAQESESDVQGKDGRPGEPAASEDPASSLAHRPPQPPAPAHDLGPPGTTGHAPSAGAFGFQKLRSEPPALDPALRARAESALRSLAERKHSHKDKHRKKDKKEKKHKKEKKERHKDSSRSEKG